MKEYYRKKFNLKLKYYSTKKAMSNPEEIHKEHFS
jgi:hypothetical protein